MNNELATRAPPMASQFTFEVSMATSIRSGKLWCGQKFSYRLLIVLGYKKNIYSFQLCSKRIKRIHLNPYRTRGRENTWKPKSVSAKLLLQPLPLQTVFSRHHSNFGLFSYFSSTDNLMPHWSWERTRKSSTRRSASAIRKSTIRAKCSTQII